MLVWWHLQADGIVLKYQIFIFFLHLTLYNAQHKSKTVY